jgi:hypothetical protein
VKQWFLGLCCGFGLGVALMTPINQRNANSARALIKTCQDAQAVAAQAQAIAHTWKDAAERCSRLIEDRDAINWQLWEKIADLESKHGGAK